MKTLDLGGRLRGALGAGGYAVLGVLFFAGLAGMLYRAARKPSGVHA
jgi:hypothetical protein